MRARARVRVRARARARVRVRVASHLDGERSALIREERVRTQLERLCDDASELVRLHAEARRLGGHHLQLRGWGEGEGEGEGER